MHKLALLQKNELIVPSEPVFSEKKFAFFSDHLKSSRMVSKQRYSTVSSDIPRSICILKDKLGGGR